MWNLILASTLALAATPVQVETLDGQRLSGELQTWSAESLVLKTAEGEQDLQVSQLAQVRPQTAETANYPEVTVYLDLIDGTKLEAVDYQVEDGKASFKLTSGQQLSVPVKQVAAVRFRAQETPELKKQWDQIRKTDTAGDLVVVRKGDALDFLDGVLGKVTDETVDFKLDEDVLAVKRTKLEGMIYFKNQLPSWPDLKAIITTHSGQKIQTQQIQLNPEGEFLITSLGGVEFKMPARELIMLDFAAGSRVYLSELMPESVSWEPFFPLPDGLPLLKQFGQPGINRALDGGPMRFMPGPDSEAKPAEYTRGVSLRSRTELVYRLPESYRRFKAKAFIDAHVSSAGEVQLTILGNDKQLFDQAISGKQAPVDIDLDISDARRLRIIVDYGQDADYADHLDLAEARVIK